MQFSYKFSTHALWRNVRHSYLASFELSKWLRNFVMMFALPTGVCTGRAHIIATFFNVFGSKIFISWRNLMKFAQKEEEPSIHISVNFHENLTIGSCLPVIRGRKDWASFEWREGTYYRHLHQFLLKIIKSFGKSHIVWIFELSSFHLWKIHTKMFMNPRDKRRWSDLPFPRRGGGNTLRFTDFLS